MQHMRAAAMWDRVLVPLGSCQAALYPTAPSGNTMTLGPNNFEQTSITTKPGRMLTFEDEKARGSEHILVIGKETLTSSEPGVPISMAPWGSMFQPGQRWTSPLWNTLGTYHVTGTIHPTTMNLPVTVIGPSTPTALAASYALQWPIPEVGS